MSRIYGAKTVIPVSRVFLFYAMHVLAMSHPTDKLSKEPLEALRAYLELAKDIPPGDLVMVPAWNAKYDETDFRITVLKQDIGLDKQPHLQVRFYPAQLEGIQEGIRGELSEEGHRRLDPLFDKLSRFITAAYR